MTDSRQSSPVPAPHLQLHDIEQELKRIYRRERSTHLVALYGNGVAGKVAAGQREFEVVPTRCELELRAAMPPIAKSYHPGRVFLVDWTHQLPLDLACRVAGQKLYHISRDARLGSLFGARQVDASLQGTALAKVLLAEGDEPWRERLGKVTAQFLRSEDAYWRFLQAFAGPSLPREADLADLLVWSASDEHGDAFARRQAADARWAKLGEELVELLSKQVGPLAHLLWQAWLGGKGLLLVQYALLVDAVREQLGQGSYAEGRLTAELQKLDAGWGHQLLQGTKALTTQVLTDALDALDRQVPAERPGRAALDGADRLIDDAAFRQASQSGLLRSGLRQRELRLARALEQATGHASPSEETLGEISAALASLDAHYLSGEVRAVARQQRVMASRLAFYLAHRAAQTEAAGTPDHHQAIALADRYVREGGYVDWARRLLRGTAGDEVFGKAFSGLLERVDALRRDDDQRFARGLVGWVEAGSPADRAIPLASVSKLVVAPFLAKGHRRLLVLLMDGMSWANAVELVASLAHESGRWGPAAWQPAGHQARAGLLPPVLASLPSLTNISRSAFFAGRQPKSGKMPSTGDDPKRWAANTHARKFSKDDEDPQLMLKDLATAQGGATGDAVKMIAGEAQLVALVINAIDDHLSGSEQIATAYTPNELSPLGPILDAAMTAERAVLLLADHGHVPGQAMTSMGARPSEGGSRWRVLREGEEPQEFEVELPAQAWRPAGAKRVVAVWDESRCYGPPKAGKHGGASLAEVVAPALLIVPDVLASARPGEVDEELTALALAAPDWWDYEGPQSASAPPAPKPKRRRRTDPSEAQLALLGGAMIETKAVAAPATPALPALVEQLKKAPVFLEHTEGQSKAHVDEALSALVLLVEAGDRLGLDHFARKSGIPEWRAPSFVSSRLSPVLNYDGYSAVEYDRQGKQLILNRKLLCQLFEIET